ncbi:hypothetical protein CERZMDRAFT_94154 [Cercospora zeae-maydis SCOH1-5]|uniref:Uncharacterized protein n=1 Tax=Cercospora zeae-maydis SCOH1-5 TaxID=717836 RepID=A0A6A6FQS5_9PEZI|nr:hypothetical protein CERZMDRAFT_94154 [Cercospora zeae-maydis SCOH1-5]
MAMRVTEAVRPVFPEWARTPEVVLKYPKNEAAAARTSDPEAFKNSKRQELRSEVLQDVWFGGDGASAPAISIRHQPKFERMARFPDICETANEKYVVGSLPSGYEDKSFVRREIKQAQSTGGQHTLAGMPLRKSIAFYINHQLEL